MSDAPYHIEVSGSDQPAEAYWRTCSDGVRVRVAVWRGGDRGTILIFPGRTEFIEKYGEVAERFVKMGYTVTAIDWRGQGLADRLHKERQMGHVGDFLDYQRDVEQLGAFATEQDLPRPFHMVAHSMGGSIGLRALHAGFNVERVIFSAPMWGIYLPPAVSLLAKIVLAILPPLGFANMLAPTRTLANYVESSPFKGNSLTTDADAFQLMQKQMKKHPELGLGGPSVHWLAEASAECANLVIDGPTTQPCLCLVGTNERIVDKRSVDNIMARWGNGCLTYFQGAEHEIFMETEETRKHAWAEIEAFLENE